MKKKSIFIVIAIILIIFIAIILYKNITNVEQEEDNNFKIVTTFYPIYIMTENITAGAQNVELTNMTDTNVGCLHDYTLVTADMKKIENADIIVQNGMGLENFMSQILSTYSNIKTIDSSKDVQNKIEENSHITQAQLSTKLNRSDRQMRKTKMKIKKKKKIYRKNIVWN